MSRPGTREREYNLAEGFKPTYEDLDLLYTALQANNSPQEFKQAIAKTTWVNNLTKTLMYVCDQHQKLAGDVIKHKDRAREERERLQSELIEAEGQIRTLEGQNKTLEKDRSKFKNELAKLKAERANNNEDNDPLRVSELQREVSELKTRLRQASVAHSTDSYGYNRTPKSRMKDPGEFSGKRDEYLGWRGKMDIKLATDRAIWESDGEKAAYIISRLDGKALDAFVHLLGPDGEATISSFDILRRLDSIYGTKNRKADALSKLSNLKQTAGQPIQEFLVEFQTLVAIAGYDDDAAKEQLLVKLNHYYYQAANAQRLLPLNDVVNFLLDTSNTQAARDKAHGTNDYGGNGRRGNRGGRGARGGNTSRGGNSSSRNNSSNASSDNKTDGNGGTGGGASTGKRDMSHVKCYNCNGMGHISKDCTKLKATAAVQIENDSGSENE